MTTWPVLSVTTFLPVVGAVLLYLLARGNDAIAARNAARKARNFAESDRIRDELLAKDIVLKDGPQGTSWEVKR